MAREAFLKWRIWICLALFVFPSARFNAAQTSADNSAKCAEQPGVNLRVERPGHDWAADFIHTNKFIGAEFPFREVPDGRTGFVGRRIDVKSSAVSIPRILLRECDHTALLDSVILQPAGAIEVEKDGRAVAIIIWGDLKTGTGKAAVGIGGSMNIVLYDMHGSGQFDSLQLGTSLGLPYVPGWVR